MDPVMTMMANMMVMMSGVPVVGPIHQNRMSAVNQLPGPGPLHLPIMAHATVSGGCSGHGMSASGRHQPDTTLSRSRTASHLTTCKDSAPTTPPRFVQRVAISRRSASRYFSAVCRMTASGNRGPGAVLSQSRVSR